LSGPSIRSATVDDIAYVLSLWEAAGGPPTVSDSIEGLSKLLACNHDALLIAESDGVPVGSLIAAWDGWRGSFYRLAVDPGRRRRGIGTALVREGEHRLRERGALRLTAIVDDGDPTALRYWSAAGYQRQQARTRFVRLVGE
jgi:ribosomal protein S18 acetylase RimI-like enzyme